jgi:hypothetical protein
MVFALGSVAQVVVPGECVMSDMGDGYEMEAKVELAIAGAGEPVRHHVAGGHLDGRALAMLMALQYAVLPRAVTSVSPQRFVQQFV